LKLLSRQHDPERGGGRGANLKVYDLRGAIPFSGDFTAQKPAANNIHRLKVFQKFLGWDTVPDGLKVLDIGKSNFISRGLGITHNTVGDLNKGVRAPDKDYDIITSFEVFAHCINPLLLTQECHRLLKPGGSLFLSTPVAGHWGIALIHGVVNMTEYKKEPVQVIHQYVGFKPVRYQQCNPWPFKFIFYGFRPPFRWLLNRFQLWEFKKL